MATRGDCTMESLTSDATQQSLTRTLLQDHSQRLEQHKNNFDILQREYLKLQQMYDKAKEDQAEANENYAHLVTKSEEIIRQLQQERDDKITECEHLRHQVMDPQKMSKLQRTITQDMEETYRKRIDELEMELEVRNGEITQLKRAYDYIKLEYSSLKASNESRTRETAKEHQAQVSLLKDKVKELSLQLERDVPSEMQRVRQLQRKNATLEEEVKQLTDENRDLKSQIHDAESNKLQELVSLKQKALEYEGVVEQLSSEKLTLNSHLKRLENDHEETQKESRRLSEELNNLQKDLLVSQRKCDDLVHQHARVKDELIFSNLKEIQTIQSEKNKFMKGMEQYKTQAENLTHTLQQLETALSNKTKEVLLIKEEMRQSDLERAVQAEKEKGELEQQLSNAQSMFLLKARELEEKLSSLQDQLASTEAEKVSLEAECEVMRRELNDKNIVMVKNNKELSELKELRRLVESLKEEKEKAEGEAADLRGQGKELWDKTQVLQHQMTHYQTETRIIIENHQKELQKINSEYTDTKISLEESRKEMSQKEKESEQKLKSVKKKKEKLKKENEGMASEMKKLLETIATNERKFVAEKEQMRKTAEEDKRMLKKQLLSFQRQQRQFQHLLISTPADIAGGMSAGGGGGVVGLKDLTIFPEANYNLSQ